MSRDGFDAQNEFRTRLLPFSGVPCYSSKKRYGSCFPRRMLGYKNNLGLHYLHNELLVIQWIHYGRFLEYDEMDQYDFPPLLGPPNARSSLQDQWLFGWKCQQRSWFMFQHHPCRVYISPDLLQWILDSEAIHWIRVMWLLQLDNVNNSHWCCCDVQPRSIEVKGWCQYSHIERCCMLLPLPSMGRFELRYRAGIPKNWQNF